MGLRSRQRRMMGVGQGDAHVPAAFAENQTSEFALDGMNRQALELNGFLKVHN
jgi:hypothetical protein